MLSIQPIKNPRTMNFSGEILDAALVYDGMTLEKLPMKHAPYRMAFLKENPANLKRMVKRMKRALAIRAS